jgi:hypothetical protein
LLFFLVDPFAGRLVMSGAVKFDIQNARRIVCPFQKGADPDELKRLVF